MTPMPQSPFPPRAPGPSKARFPRLLIVLGALVLLLFGGLVALVVAMKPGVGKGSILVVRLEGQLAEAAPDNPWSQLVGGQQMSLAGLRRLADALADDSNVAGVLLEVGPISSGFASVAEARAAISRIRDTKKPVYAVLVGDMVEEKDYLVASAADRIILSPEAGVLLNGFVAEVTFYKGLLEKLHVEPQYFQFKEYKSAAEPFINKQMSAPMREAISAILENFTEHLLGTVSERRGIDKDTLRALADRGGLTAAEALEAKLVDELGWPHSAEADLRKAAGVASGKPRRIKASTYLGLSEPPTSGKAIAVIYAVGPISATGGGGLFGGEGIHGPTTAAHIREAAEDESVKAIVLRVNSPGGSAVGSDFVWRAVKDARQKKPVVVSMGDVAGSGGYWISMAADAIVAEATTITGSIGVVGGKFNIKGLYEMVGASVDSVKLGANADLFSPFRSFDQAQSERFTAWMGQVYDDFVKRVAEGRGLTPEVAEPLAHGRIWSGDAAKERKLVDEVGGFARAVELAKAKANLPKDAETHLVRFPRRKGLLESLQEGELPGVSILTGEVSLEGALERVLAEVQTMQPWVLTPTIHIH